MKITKYVLVVVVFIIAYHISYKDISNVPIFYLIIWGSITFLIGTTLPFLIYTSSLSNRKIEKNNSEKKYIKPKIVSKNIGIILLSFGLGLLRLNNFDIVILTFLSFSIGSILAQRLYSLRKYFW